MLSALAGLDPTSILQNVLSVAQAIYDQVQLVRSNRAQCKTLSGRIQEVALSLKNLSHLPRSENFINALQRMYEHLNECLIFINKFSEKKWFIQAIKGGTDKEYFNELTQTLRDIAQQLNLGLSAQQLLNSEQDRKDRELDQQEFIQNLEEIIHLNQQHSEGLQRLEVGQRERDHILAGQLASMQAQLSMLLVGAEKKPLLDNKYLTKFYEVSFDKEIGHGSFGTIFAGRWQEAVVAIKTFSNKLSDEGYRVFIREIKILSRLNHPNIIQFYGACIEQERACYLMEFAEKGDLSRVLQQNNRVHTALTVQQQKTLILDIARGLVYLHNQNILHRDLKAANVLITDNFRAKLTDFGLSQTKTASVQSAELKSQAFAYYAPELFIPNEIHTKASDIYSFGVILWEIVMGKLAFSNIPENKLMQHRLSGATEQLPATLPKCYREIIQACWQKEPSQRWELADIIMRVEQYNSLNDLKGEACYEQGIKFEQEKEFARAFEAYNIANQKGFYKAATNLSSFYQGKIAGVVSTDKKKANELLLMAANKGHARAQYNLGLMLSKGDGVTQDIPEAIHWFEEAAKQGDKDAAKKAEGLKAQNTNVSKMARNR